MNNRASDNHKSKKKSFPYVGIIVFAMVIGILTGGGLFVSRIVIAMTTMPEWSVTPHTPTKYSYTPSSLIPTPEPDETPYPYETPVETPEATPEESLEPTPTPVPPTEEDMLVAGKDYLNILLMGYDGSAGRDKTGEWEFYRTDTLILCTIYFKTNKVTLTSVPRDTRVAFPFYNYDPNNMDKINSVTSRAHYAGVTDTNRAIMDTVSKLFGNVPIDYYFSVNMDAFAVAIDAMGGVDYNVEMDIIDKETKKLLVAKGQQHLNGKQALNYVRFRGTAMADLDRTTRQRKFLISVFSQMKSLNSLVNLPKIYNDIKDKVSSNLTYENILYLANFAASNIETNSITSQMFPGSAKTINSISYYVVDAENRKYLIAKMFGIPYDRQD